MGNPIKNLSIQGFKSIRNLDAMELGPLNVLIGANGSGKSNFVDFFRLLRAMADENLSAFVIRQGGSDGFFFLGPKFTPRIKADLKFGDNEYRFELQPAANGAMFVSDESFRYVGGQAKGYWTTINAGGKESNLKAHRKDQSELGPWPGVGNYVYASVANWTVYHFHDTSALAPVRREQSLRDFSLLRPDASNLAAYLLNLRSKNGSAYELIRDAVRLIAPFFDDFLFRPETSAGEEKLRLEWRQKGTDFPFQPSQLSDGTLRYICLATALLQPELPPTIIIDEPELGLHPHALEVLAGMIQKASTRTQVIVATQSSPLLSQFDPQDVIVTTRQNEASEFRRLGSNEFEAWLNEYTLGELWQKNYVEGASYG